MTTLNVKRVFSMKGEAICLQRCLEEASSWGFAPIEMILEAIFRVSLLVKLEDKRHWGITVGVKGVSYGN